MLIEELGFVCTRFILHRADLEMALQELRHAIVQPAA